MTQESRNLNAGKLTMEAIGNQLMFNEHDPQMPSLQS